LRFQKYFGEDNYLKFVHLFNTSFSPIQTVSIEVGGYMKILVIDHHVQFREGLYLLLKKMPMKVEQILEAGNFLAGLKKADLRPDLILLEIKTPECGGAISVHTCDIISR
jgi:PleD family two-component response regulator